MADVSIQATINAAKAVAGAMEIRDSIKSLGPEGAKAAEIMTVEMAKASESYRTLAVAINQAKEKAKEQAVAEREAAAATREHTIQVREIRSELLGAAGSAGGFANALIGGGGVMAAVLIAAKAIEMFRENLHAGTEAIEEQEKAGFKLVAMFQGDAEAAGEMAAAAEKLAATTPFFGAAQIVSGEAYARLMGLTKTEILKLTPVLMDLSTVMGVDMDSAYSAVARGMEGQMKGLRSLGIFLDKTATAQEVLNAVLDKAAGAHKAAAAMADTFGGRQAQLAKDTKAANREMAESFLDTQTKIVNAYIEMERAAANFFKNAHTGDMNAESRQKTAGRLLTTPGLESRVALQVSTDYAGGDSPKDVLDTLKRFGASAASIKAAAKIMQEEFGALATSLRDADDRMKEAIDAGGTPGAKAVDREHRSGLGKGTARDPILEDQKKAQADLQRDLFTVDRDGFDLRLGQAAKHYQGLITLAHGNQAILVEAQRQYEEEVGKIWTEWHGKELDDAGKAARDVAVIEMAAWKARRDARARFVVDQQNAHYEALDAETKAWDDAFDRQEKAAQDHADKVAKIYQDMSVAAIGAIGSIGSAQIAGTLTVGGGIRAVGGLAGMAVSTQPELGGPVAGAGVTALTDMIAALFDKDEKNRAAATADAARVTDDQTKAAEALQAAAVKLQAAANDQTLAANLAMGTLGKKLDRDIETLGIKTSKMSEADKKKALDALTVRYGAEDMRGQVHDIVRKGTGGVTTAAGMTDANGNVSISYGLASTAPKTYHVQYEGGGAMPSGFGSEPVSLGGFALGGGGLVPGDAIKPGDATDKAISKKFPEPTPTYTPPSGPAPNPKTELDLAGAATLEGKIDQWTALMTALNLLTEQGNNIAKDTVQVLKVKDSGFATYNRDSFFRSARSPASRALDVSGNIRVGA